jgi:hypothetical protein
MAGEFGLHLGFETAAASNRAKPGAGLRQQTGYEAMNSEWTLGHALSSPACTILIGRFNVAPTLSIR